MRHAQARKWNTPSVSASRSHLSRLLLTLPWKRQMQKTPQRLADVDRVTPYQLTDWRHTPRTRAMPADSADGCPKLPRSLRSVAVRFPESSRKP
jgi:hypothetical protein